MRFYDPFSDDPQHFGQKDEPIPALWMLTIADLLSLILTFFVMLFAMSDVKQEQWEKVSQSLYEASKRPVDETITSPDDKAVERITLVEGRNLAYLQYSLQSKLETLGLPYVFERGKEQLVLTLPLHDILAEGTLSPHGVAILENIGQVVARQSNALSVKTIMDSGQAHTWQDALFLSGQVGLIFHQQGYESPIPVEAAMTQVEDSPHIEIVIRETVANFFGNR